MTEGLFRDDNINVDHKWVDGEKRFARHVDGNDNEIPSAEEKKTIEDFDRMNPSQLGAHRIWVSRGDFARIQHQKPSDLVAKEKYNDGRDLFPGYIHHLNEETGAVKTDVYACEYQGDEMFMPCAKTIIDGDSENDIMAAYEKIRDLPPASDGGKERTVGFGLGGMGVSKGQRREVAGNGGLSARKEVGGSREYNGKDDRTVNGASGSSELDVKDNGVRYSRVTPEDDKSYADAVNRGDKDAEKKNIPGVNEPLDHHSENDSRPGISSVSPVALDRKPGISKSDSDIITVQPEEGNRRIRNYKNGDDRIDSSSIASTLRGLGTLFKMGGG